MGIYITLYTKDDSPAVVHYNKDGLISSEYYFINGKWYSEEDYHKEKDRRNSRSNILKMVEGG